MPEIDDTAMVASIEKHLKEELGPEATGTDISKLNPDQRDRLWAKVREDTFGSEA